MKTNKVHPQKKCPICSSRFDVTRKDKQYCSRKCQKNASSKATPTKRVRTRTLENLFRNRDHYERSMWLTHDLFRTPEPNRSIMIQKLLEAASGDNAKIRNILLDPQLLGASKIDPRGRSRHDCKIGVSNIAKQVYQFCMNNYGCSTKDCILDEGKPAGRFFVGDPIAEASSNIERCEPNRKHVTILKSQTGLSRQAYHGMLVVEFEEKLIEVKLAA